MKFFVILLALCLIAVSSAHRMHPGLAQTLANLGYVKAYAPNSGRIVGGVETTIANHPHQVVMLKGGSFTCGGSIISTQWALTAGHCLEDYPTASRVQFRAGSTDRTTGGLLVTTTEYHLHPKYDAWTANYDAAVAKVTPSFSGTNIKPIPLAASGTELSSGTQVTVSGWGRTETGSLPTKLRVVSVPVVAYDACKAYWGSNLYTTMMCAGIVNKDSCNGDSGGPLVYNGVQHGIVSYGDAQCGSKNPAVYAKISNAEIRSFIRQTTNV